MRLAVLVDVIAKAAGVAVILMAADHCADDAAGDRAHSCTSTCANAWQNRARKRAGAGADCRSGRRARDTAAAEMSRRVM